MRPSLPCRARLVGATLVLVTVIASGCSTLLGTRNDPPRLYVLTAEPPASGAAAITAPIVLGLGPVSLPGYLDRRGVVTRVAPNRLDASRNDLWAEPLATNFEAVLEQNLRLRLPGVPLRSFPWPQGAAPDLAVSVDVTRFEADAAGNAELQARWTIRKPGAATVVATRDTALTTPIGEGGAEATVAALSAAIGTLSDQIASELAGRAAGLAPSRGSR